MIKLLPLIALLVLAPVAHGADRPAFGPAIKLDPRGGTEPRAAVGLNDHRFVITNRESDSKATVFVSADRGATWKETGDPFPGQQQATIDVDVITMPDGSMVATELDSAGLRFPSAVTPDEGKTWIQSRGSNEAADQDRQFIAGTGSTVYMTWHNLGSGTAVHNVFVAKSTDGGVTFGAPVPVALPGSDAFQDLQCAAGYPSSIAVNPKTGRVYVFYITRAAPVASGVDLGGCGASVFGPFEINIISATRVWVATSEDGTQWENSLAVDTSASGKIVAMQFAPGTIDNQGNVWVVHPESPKPYPDYTGAAIKLAVADPELTAWKSVTADPGAQPGSILHHIAVGDPGKVAIAYMRGAPAGDKTAWYTHVMTTDDALAASPKWDDQRLSEVVNYVGTASELMGACDSPGPGGLVCPRAIDNFGMALDADCRVTVTWPAENNDLGPEASGTYVATQTGGPGLCRSAAGSGATSGDVPGGGGSGSGSGAPVGPFCRDTGAPTVTRSRRGVRATRRTITISGRAKDRGCVNGKPGQPVTGTITKVEVAVARLRGKRCAFLSARGRAARAAACTKPRWLRAKGTNAWKLAVRGRLARGSYAFYVRGFDRSGNVTPARRAIRFRVR
jgi:hypothetical protein